jgi:hypothetical protein
VAVHGPPRCVGTLKAPLIIVRWFARLKGQPICKFAFSSLGRMWTTGGRVKVCGGWLSSLACIHQRENFPRAPRATRIWWRAVIVKSCH